MTTILGTHMLMTTTPNRKNFFLTFAIVAAMLFLCGGCRLAERAIQRREDKPVIHIPFKPANPQWRVREREDAVRV